MNQTIVNLLSNAAKFSPKGETVEISVKALGSFPQIFF
jgi:signal transduction histidine kinase